MGRMILTGVGMIGLLFVSGVVVAQETPRLVHVPGAIAQTSLKGLVVCADPSDIQRGLVAAIAVSRKLQGWQTYVRDGVCNDGYGDAPAVTTGNGIPAETADGPSILEAFIVDDIGYVIIPANTPLKIS